MPKLLTSEEKRIIWENRYKLSARKIALLIGRTPVTIIKYLRECGVTIHSSNRQ